MQWWLILYSAEKSSAEQSREEKSSARHIDAILRCHDFSFRLTDETLTCRCPRDVLMCHLLMTDDDQVPTNRLSPLDDTLTVKTSTFDAMVPRSVPKIDDHDDNNYEHLWSSGTTYPCHGWDPGSIPGKCTFWLHVPQIPSSYILYFDIDHSDFSSVQDPLSFLFWLRTIIRLPIPDFFFLSPDASDPKITSVDVLP